MMSPLLRQAPFDLEFEENWRVRLRPLHPGDVDRVQRAYQLISEESRINRFWEKPAELSLSRARGLTDTDPYQHVAWVVIDPDDDDFPGFAAASYWRDQEQPDRAEIAFTVGDAWHGRGLATLLLSILWYEGWHTGLRDFYGYCRFANQGMVQWWQRLGGGVRQGTRQYELHLPLEEPAHFVERVRYGMPSGAKDAELADWMSEWMRLTA